MVCYNPPIAPHHYVQFEPPVLLNGSNTFVAWLDLGRLWVVAIPLWPLSPSPAPSHSHCVQGYSCLVTGFQPCGTLQSCHPTTHRAVRSVSCPPPHHLQECRPESPLSARVGGGSVPPAMWRHRSGVLKRGRGRPPYHAFLPAICEISRGASSIGSPTPSARGVRKQGSPSAAKSIRIRLGT